MITVNQEETTRHLKGTKMMVVTDDDNGLFIYLFNLNSTQYVAGSGTKRIIIRSINIHPVHS